MNYAAKLQNGVPGVVKKSYPLFKNEVIEILDNKHLLESVRYLREACGFQMLLDISALDWLKHPKKENFPTRFELDYFFYKMETHERVQLKVFVPDGERPEVDSITGIFPIADWMERECFDMMGIYFKDHPNLTRLLMWENFEGHPLRKDYPLNKRQPIPISDEIVE